jgi:xylan 1,4-beta-xylosidase
MLALGLGAAACAPATAAAQPVSPPNPLSEGSACNGDPDPLWGRGPEGQRQADLGDGRFLNPIFAGDHPDPTILKDGDDYYITFSSFDASPGLVIWRSRDLVNWTPVGPALPDPIGTVFAVDLVKHNGRYFIYIPFIPSPWSTRIKDRSGIFVIYADRIEGPWSAPIDLGIRGFIDPGHVIGEDGKRYLFLSGVSCVRLKDDGLGTEGPIVPAYKGWKYPDDWITEAYSLEGPKLVRRGDWFYLVSAVGGTSGPATGHMVIAARSRSVSGPWENCPHNPIVRTRSSAERWWSRGHGTLVEGPGGQWFLVYHGYENGYRSLGRQTLLEPVEWTDDGWFRAVGGDLSLPFPKPRAVQGDRSGVARSDDFTSPALGIRWNFYSPGPGEAVRASFGDGLLLAGKGSGPQDSSPLCGLAGDHAYECGVEMELIGDVEGGLLLFFNRNLFLGFGHDGEKMTTYKGGRAAYWAEPAPPARRLHLKLVNNHQVVTLYYSMDGANWTRHAIRSEVSGYHANVADDLLSLRPALFASGRGQVRFRNFVYRART